MKASIKAFSLALLLAVLSLVNSASAQTISTSLNTANKEWILARETPNAAVYVRRNAQGFAEECKIVTELAAPINDANTFLSNFDNYQKWVSGYVSTGTLKSVPGKELYGYALIQRGNDQMDAVLHITYSKTATGWIGSISAAPDYVNPSPLMPRLTHLSGMWALQPTSTGNSKFTYHIQFKANPDETAAAQNEMLIENHFQNVLHLQKIFSDDETAQATTQAD